MSRNEKLIFTAVAAPLLLLYLATAPSTVYWQDSGIYLAGVKTLGVIYPPGYPLYLVLARVWVEIVSRLTFNLFTFAYYVHSLSALFGSLSAAIVSLAVYKLLKYKTQKGFVAIPIITGLFCGVSYSLWSQSINSEVYALSGLFASLIYFFLLNILLDDRQKALKRNILALVAVLGLSMANHPSAILFFPVILYFAYIYKLPHKFVAQHKLRSVITLLLVFLLTAALPYSYLFIRSNAEPFYLWNKIDNLGALLYHVAGREYSSAEISFTLHNFSRLISYPVLFWQEYYLLTPLFFLGAYVLYKHSARTKLFTIIGIFLFIIFGSFLYFYIRGGEYNYWLISVYNFGYIFVGIGIWEIGKKLKNNAFLYILLSVLLLATILINWRFNNRRSFNLAEQFGENILSTLPQNSAIFVVGDQDSSITKYLQSVKDVRSDVAILRSADFDKDWKRQHMAKLYPDFEFSGTTEDFVSDNIDSHDIFLIQRASASIPDDYTTEPAGTIWKVVEEDGPINLAYWDYDFSDSVNVGAERKESPRQIKDELGRVAAIVRREYSSETFDFRLQAKKNLADYCLNAYKEKKSVKVIKEDGKVQEWRDMTLLACARDNYEAMFEIDPAFYNPEIWKSRSEVYELLGEPEKARELYNEFLLKSTNK